VLEIISSTKYQTKKINKLYEFSSPLVGED
jgi:hypothetical protein